MVGEFAAAGTEDDKECLAYVRDAAAGSSEKLFPNSPHPRDCGPNGLLPQRKSAFGRGKVQSLPTYTLTYTYLYLPTYLPAYLPIPTRGKVLEDFAAEALIKAKLHEAHTLALRIYSTAAFRSLLEPLRSSDLADPHPFPGTV